MASYGKLLQYVDDTALGTSTEEVHRSLTEDLQSLSSWITQSKIKLNTTNHTCGLHQKNPVAEAIPTVCVGETSLKSVSTQKYLGVVFDKELSWNSHLSTICKKISYHLYMLD